MEVANETVSPQESNFMTKIPLFDGATIAGTSHSNHDTWESHGNAAWVIDGATPSPTATGVMEGGVESFVALLSEMIHESLDSKSGETLQSVLYHALSNIKEYPLASTYSATVAMMRFDGNYAEWLALGDVTVIIERKSGLRTVSDKRLSWVAQDIRESYLDARSKGLDASVLHSQLVAEENRWRNRPGGFWVAGNRPQAAYQASVGRGVVQGISIASDGVLDALPGSIRREDVAEWKHLGAQGAISRLRENIVEKTGRSDDITLVLTQAQSA